MDSKRYLLVWVGLCLAMLLGSGPTNAASNYEDIVKLYQQGRLKDAYKLANQYLPEGEGDPAFDYLYGQIAIDNGDVSRGVFALERVVLIQPDHLYARLELARGYYILGQADRAEEQFDQVLATNPSQAIRDKIALYKKAIRVKQSAYKTMSTAYREFSFGYDTNINSAPNDATFTSSIFGTGTLTDDSLSQDSYFGEISLGGLVTHPIAEGRHLFAGVGLDQRVNERGSTYDLGSLTVRGGINAVEGNKRMQLSATAQHTQLDYSGYRNLAYVTLDGQHLVSSNTRVGGFLRGGIIDYEELDNYDAYTGSVGLSTVHVVNSRLKPVYSAMAFFSKDDPTDNDLTSRELADKESMGLLLKGKVKLDSRSSLTLSLLHQGINYQVEDSAFLVRRKDDYTKVSFHYSRMISSDWELKLEVSHSELNSNIPIYSYDRDLLSVGFRYEY